MKKNIKKQSNKKLVTTQKKGKIVLIGSKKVAAKNISSSSKVVAKTKKQPKSKSKAALKNNKKIILKQNTKKIIKNKSAKKNNNSILSFGNIQPSNGKILLLVIAIILVASVLIVQKMIKVEEVRIEKPVASAAPKRNVVLEKEINDLVAGYPIEKMTRYIAKQDPKVAAFMIAIARKESAWGDRKPVLNGEDCYNYWGFRLKSDRMGSGGHTCFDSPQEAVEIVGARLNHLVNEEKIDTPKEMVIWKCGYSCDGPEAAGSQKWIKDVDYYYKQMIN